MAPLVCFFLAAFAVTAAASQDSAPAPDPPEAAPLQDEAASGEVGAAATAPAEPEAEAVTQPAPSANAVSLEQAINIALRGNFGLLASADGLAAARLELGVQRAEFFPKLTPRFTRSPDETMFGASLDQAVPWSGASLRADFATHTPHDELAERTSDLHVTLVQPLLRGFGPLPSLAALYSARRGYQGQQRSFELARQALIVQVTEAFYQVVRQRQLLDVSRQSLKRSASLKKASQARMQVGMVSKLDVFRAEIQEAQAQESLVAAETGLETALESFRVLLGLTPRAAIEPQAVELETDVALEIEPLDVLLTRAREQRLDLQESRDRVRDARRSLALARQSLLPTLDVNVELSQTGVGSTLADSLKSLDRRVGVTLSAGFPVQRAAERAQRAIGELNVRAAERSLSETERRVEADVLAAVRRLERLRKSIDLQRQGLAFAEQQQRLATLRYQRGLASNFDVVDAEGNLVSARTALVGLVTDFAVARMQLLRVVGTLDVPSEDTP